MAAGAVAGNYTYDVFGQVRTHTGASTEWSFTGEQNDPNGLEYLRARYYDPAVGRFLGRDPWPGSVLSPLSLNPYSYVLNNPVNWIDPWGLQAQGALVFVPGVGWVAAAGATACTLWAPCRGAVIAGIEAGGEAVVDLIGNLFSGGGQSDTKRLNSIRNLLDELTAHCHKPWLDKYMLKDIDRIEKEIYKHYGRLGPSARKEAEAMIRGWFENQCATQAPILFGEKPPW